MAAITELNVNLCLFAPNIEAVPKVFDDSLVFHSYEPIDLVVPATECDVVVTNGGLNTVSSCFQAGIPQLVIANNLERYMVGRKLELSGAGILSSMSSTGTLSSKLRTILVDRGFPRAAARCASQYRGEDSTTQLNKMISNIERILGRV